MTAKWLWLIVGFVLVSFAGGYGRRFIVKNAPFYARANILVVGGFAGVFMAIIITGFISTFTNFTLSRIALRLWGLLSMLYLGHEPDAIDWARKAQQVSYIAVLAYGITTLSLLLL
jgi:hypothetical protein